MTDIEEKEKAKEEWLSKHGSMRGFELVWKKQHPEEYNKEMSDDDVAVSVVVPEAKDELAVDDIEEIGNSEEHVELVNEDFEMFWQTTGLNMLRHGHSPKSLLQRTLSLSGNGCSYADFVRSVGSEEFKKMVTSGGRNNPGDIEKLARLAWKCSPSK